MNKDQMDLIDKQAKLLEKMMQPTMYVTQETLRDQFAMAALSVLRELHPAPLRWKDVALTAYELADAMMEARK